MNDIPPGWVGCGHCEAAKGAALSNYKEPFDHVCPAWTGEPVAGDNDWSVRGHDMPVGPVFHSDQPIERRSLHETPFFTDYLVQFDFEVGLIALLDRHDGDQLCLCTPGPDDGKPKLIATALKLLVPHLQRAVRIARRLGEAELSARSARAALDRAP